MKIAIGSDGKSNLTNRVVEEVTKMGHSVELFGALSEGADALWPTVGKSVGEKVASGQCDQGILLCWTGTGVSIAANKVKGIRAALCSDAETAKGARVWNDANVLALSMRALSEEVAKEILTVWFNTQPSAASEDKECFRRLAEMDS